MLKRSGTAIPAIDLLGGAVVRLHQGRYDRVTQFDGDPVELARRFVAQGAEWVHVIDLEAARTGERRADHRAFIEQIVAVDGLQLQLGGGFRSAADIEWAVELGAARVLVGSFAAAEPAEVGELARCTGVVAAAVDCLDGSVRTRGWEHDTGKPLGELIDVLCGHGVRDYLVTAIGRDGTGLGPDLELLELARRHVPGTLIAAGGVATAADIGAAIAAGADAVVSGRAILDGSLDVADALRAARA